MPYLNHTSIITHHDNNGLVCPRLFFIHSGCFYSTSSSPLLLRGAPNTARILCRGFTPKRHRQLRVKDLSKVPMWRLELDSNLWPFGRKALNLLIGHHVPQDIPEDVQAYNRINTDNLIVKSEMVSVILNNIKKTGQYSKW